MRRLCRALTATLLAATIGAQQVQAQQFVPYFRFNKSAPLSSLPPGMDPNQVPGTGDLRVFGPVQVRARFGVPFEYKFKVEGANGRVVWTLSEGSLPPGLSLSPDGTLSGTPEGDPQSDVSLSGIVVAGQDQGGKAGRTRPFRIDVKPIPLVTTEALYTGRVGQALTVSPSARNTWGSQAWRVEGRLPVGMYPAADGAITGTPEEKGTFSGLMVGVRDSDGASGWSAPFTIDVASNLTITGLKPSYASRVGRPMQAARPSASGLQGSPLWDLSPLSAKLPDGLSFNAGTLSGTPTVRGETPGVVLRVQDSVSRERVSSAPVTIKVGSLPRLAMQPHYFLRGGRIGPRTHTITPGQTDVLGGGSWFLNGVLPGGYKLEDDTGVITGSSGQAAKAEGLTLKVVDLHDGEEAVSNPFAIETAPPVAIHGFSPPDAVAGQPYRAGPPSVSGIYGEAVWDLTGSLPDGLAFDAASGAIVGTATTLGSVDGLRYSVRDTHDDETDAMRYPFSLRVVPFVPFAVAPLEAAYPANVGRTFSLAPSPQGQKGALTWGLTGDMPSWATFNPGTGLLSGKPEAVGPVGPLAFSLHDAATGETVQSTQFTIDVAPGAGLTVSMPASLSVSPGIPYESPAPVTSNHTNPVSYALGAGTLPPGLSVDEATGRVRGTTSVLGDFPNVVVSAVDKFGSTGASAPFRVSVREPTSTLAVTMANVTTSVGGDVIATPVTNGFTGDITWSLIGERPDWLAFDPATGRLSGRPTATGVVSGLALMAVGADGKGARSNDFSVAVVDQAPLAVTFATEFTGRVGDLFRALPSVKGDAGGLRWSLTGTLPDGLVLNPDTGEISGRPTASATATGLVLAVTDASNASGGTRPFSITIAPRPTQLTVSLPQASHVGRVGAPFTTGPATAADSTGAVAWTLAAGSLPDGLSLNAATGAIQGSMSYATTLTGLVLKARDEAGLEGTSAPFSVNFLPPLALSGLQAAYDGRQKLAFAPVQVTAANTSGSVRWSATGLPNGLTVSGAGVLAGTPSVSGTFPVTVTVEDAADKAKASATTTLTVHRELQITGLSSPLVARVGHPYSSGAPGIVGQRGSLAWEVVGQLPSWAGIDATTGIISGLPRAVESTTGLRLKVTDARDGATAEAGPFSLEAFAAPDVVDMPTSFMARYQFEFRSTPPKLLNSVGAVKWTWGPGTPPAWATLQANGSITGTPDTMDAAAGLTLVGTDATGASAASVPFAINVFSMPEVRVATNAYKQRVGDAFSLKPAVTGVVGTPSWRLVTKSGTLPAGLGFSEATGELSGTITGTGLVSFAIQVTDSSDGTTVESTPVSLSVNQPLALAGLAPSYGVRVNKFLTTDQPQVTGAAGAVTYTISNRPAGMSLDPVTGILSGTPTSSFRERAVTLTATDAYDNRTATLTFDLMVEPAMTAAATPTTVYLRHGADASTSLFAATTANALYPEQVRWAKTAGVTFPAWLNVDPATGKLVGAPPASAGTAQITGLRLTATDTDGATAMTPTFSVLPRGPLAVAYGTDAYAARAGVQYTTVTPTISNLIGTSKSFTLTTLSGTAPASASVNSSGVVTFRPDPASVGTWVFRTTVKDAVDGVTADSLPITVTITDAPQVEASDLVVRATGTGRMSPQVSRATGSVTWTMSSLLNGSVNSTTGEVTLAPIWSSTQDLRENGRAPVTVTLTATDADGAKGTGTFTATVLPPPRVAAPLARIDDSWGDYIPRFTIRKGEPFAGPMPSITAPVEKYTWALASSYPYYDHYFHYWRNDNCTLAPLPEGLTVDPNTGQISGTMTVDPTTKEYCVRATDSGDGAYGGYKFLITNLQPLAMTGLDTQYTVTRGLPYSWKGTVNTTGAASFATTGTLPLGWSQPTVSGKTITLAGTVASDQPLGDLPVTITVTDAADGARLTHTVTLKVVEPISVTMASIAPRYNSLVSLVPTVAGGTGPYSWVMSAGSLPSGLTLNAQTGEISGRLNTQNGIYRIKLKLTDANGVQGETPEFTISPKANDLAISTSGQMRWHVGTTRTVQATALRAQGPVTWSTKHPVNGAASAWPAWLTLAADGTVTGSPTASGTTGTLNLYVTDTSDGAWDVYQFQAQVTPALTASISTTSYVMAVGANKGTVQPGYGNVIGNVSWSIAPGGTVPPGLNIRTDGIVYGSPEQPGVYTFRVRATDSYDGTTADTAEITVDVRPMFTVSYPAAPTVRQYATLTPHNLQPTLQDAVGPLTYDWWNSPPSGWILDRNTGRITGNNNTVVGLQSHPITVRDTATNASTRVNVQVTTAPGPEITFSGPLNWRVGLAPPVTISVANTNGSGPLSFTATSLPAGLSVDGATGALSGTPTTASNTALTVRVTDTGDGSHSTKGILPKIVAPLTITANASYPAKVGTMVSIRPGYTGLGGTYTWTYAGLPAWMTKPSVNSDITGTPPAGAAGTYPVTVTLTDSHDGHSVSKSFDIVVSP